MKTARINFVRRDKADATRRGEGGAVRLRRWAVVWYELTEASLM
jgi:hypothetical protein